MEAPESLRFILNSPVRLRVLRQASDPVTLNELVDSLSYSRPSIRAAAEWYTEQGWFEKQDSRYSRTVSGTIVLRHLDGSYEAGGSSIDREDMQFICDSTVRSDLLDYSLLPVAPRDLIDYCDADSTVANRMMHSLADRDWYERQGQVYRRTSVGDAAHDDFERLLTVFEQIAEKKPLFARLPEDIVDVPITSLADATLIDPRDGPDTGLAALRRIGASASGGSLDHIRTICPVFRPTMASTMREFVSFDTTTEIVYDEPTFRKLCAPKQLPALCATVVHPHTSVRVYPDNLSFGVGTYDEQGMIMAYNDQPGNAAGIVSPGEEITGWIDATVTDYWQQSQPVSESLAKMLSRYADSSIWTVSNATFWGAEDEDERASETLYESVTP